MSALGKVRRAIAAATSDLDSPSARASRQMLEALTVTGKHVYAGTVSPAEKARRRASNRRARVARRAHR